MKPASIITIVVAIATVVVAAVLTTGGGSGGSDSAATASSPTPKGSLELTFAISPEKEQLLAPIVEQFNADKRQVDGKAVYVNLLGVADDAGNVSKSINSGDAENLIARGKLKPDVWSPASSAWGRLLNLHADRAYVADENPSLVRTPLVIAMWKPMAETLGYPDKPVGFSDLTKLATSPDGWASVGAPQFGAFKYVHTNPDSSTSGVSAVAASYFAVAGKTEGLTQADVRKASPRVRDLERSIVHYGDSTLFIADELCKRGPAYASAVAMEETTLIEFNQRKGCQTSGHKLVAVYPAEGSFYSDSPYIVLDAPWVTPAKRKAAAAFEKYLSEQLDAETVGRYGFRPADEDAKPAGLVSAANGVTASQPKRVMRLPDTPVLDRLLDTWRADRKPSNVMLVVDVSGSMNDQDKLKHAREGLKGFLGHVAPQDRIGLMSFSGDVTKLIDPAPFQVNKQALTAAIDGLTPDGATALYDATYEGVEEIKRTASAETINAVVVLTDGEESGDSSRGQQQVLDRLAQEGDAETNGVRVFTIAYGSDPNSDALKEFAAATGGKAFSASTSDIEQVYRSISSFF